MDRSLLTLFDLTAWILTAISVAMTLRTYPQLPARVATHFGFISGVPSRYGPKMTIFVLHLVQAALIVALDVACSERLGSPTGLKTVLFVGTMFNVDIAALAYLQRALIDVALRKRTTLRGGLTFTIVVFAGAALAALAASIAP